MARSDDDFRSGTSRDIEKEIEKVSKIEDEKVNGAEEFEEFEEFKEFENEASKEEHETGNETENVVNDLIYDVADKVVGFLEGSSEEDNAVLAGVLNYINKPKESLYKDKLNLKPNIKKDDGLKNSTSNKARKRLWKALVKNIFMNAILLIIVTFAVDVIKGMTIDDLYMYGYKDSEKKDVEILNFIESYNIKHANSYLIPNKDEGTGEYKSLSLVVENINYNNYKSWDLANKDSKLIDYVSRLNEDDLYNMELEFYKLGDEVALSMYEKFGNTLTFGVYLGEPSPERYVDSVYDSIDTVNPNDELVLMYDLDGKISRVSKLPIGTPDYFSGYDINNLPNYKEAN